MISRVVAAVGDRYDVEGELGRGGSAVVYRARDNRLRRAVAIKVLPPELAFRADVRSRFLREAQTAAQLSHPHIVPIYTVDEQDGLVFFVMGLVDGESLGALLLREPRPPLPVVVRVLREVASALGCAHEHGVVHRDIKPDNILLDRRTGGAMVTDFGIARALEESSRLTATGIAVGTPAFMSPEQALGEREVDVRSDVYGLGVLGYLMIAGELPFRASNTPSMLLKHISEIPRPLAEHRADVPAQLAWVVERALQKSPDERWPDGSAMSAALQGDLLQPPRSFNVDRGATLPSRTSGDGERNADPVTRRPRPPSAQRNDNGVAAAPPPLGRGGDETRALWRREQQAWRDRVRQRAEPEPSAPKPPKREKGDESALERFRERALDDQLIRFRRRLASTTVTLGVLAGINLLTFPFPWVIFPAIGMGSPLLKRWRVLQDAGITWSDVMAGRVPPHLGGSDRKSSANELRRERALSRRGAAWNDLTKLEREVRSFRKWLLVMALMPIAGMLSLVMSFAVGDPAPLLLWCVAAIPATVVTTSKASRFRSLGLRVRDLIGSGWRKALLAADPRPQSAIAAAAAASLVPREVLDGKYGASVRNAVEDRWLVGEALRRLSDSDKQFLPDVEPTVNALVERVAMLAQALHRLAAEVPDGLLLSIDDRIRVAEADSGSGSDQERRLHLLQRQRATVEDLVRRQAMLAGQLESASLVLQSVRLDLLKLRSVGMQSALEDVTSATQQARALSRDIAHALDAAAEVRAL